MVLRIEKTLKGFYIEDESVLGERVVFIGEENEGILCNQLEHLYSELLMIYKLRLSKMECKDGKCNCFNEN